MSEGVSAVARGRAAERRVAQYYSDNGAQILCMNYCVRGGEIDVIAREGEYVVFIEVKSRASVKFGLPEDAVTRAKQRRICRAALIYAQEHGLTDEYMRFDVCALNLGKLTVYKNAFDFI